MNCESSVGPVRREMHVLCVPLTPMVTSRVIEELTRPPEVEEPRTAPVQSGVPAGRRTRVSPGDAKLPRTLRVICVFGAMVEGVNQTSGGGSNGGGANGGGAVQIETGPETLVRVVRQEQTVPPETKRLGPFGQDEQ